MIQFTHTPEIKVLLNIFYYARSALIQSVLLFYSTLFHEKQNKCNLITTHKIGFIVTGESR